MYWHVPRIVPSAVSAGGSIDSVFAAAATAGAALFARPKSSSFAPACVSMTFAGFRSRWTMPERWALSSASPIVDRVAQGVGRRQRTAGQSLGERLAFEILEHEKTNRVISAARRHRGSVRRRRHRARRYAGD